MAVPGLPRYGEEHGRHLAREENPVTYGDELQVQRQTGALMDYPTWVVTESEQKLHDDFRAMLWLIWRHLRLPDPTRRQLRIARWLQNGPRRRMVEAFRGVGKTWLTCAYALWRLYRNPNERVKIVSANEEKAIENATFIRRLIEEVPELQFLRPRGSARDSVLAFDVAPSAAHPTPSVSCCGITGQMTGGRATLLISDDVEVPKNSFTETMRERLAELIKEYDALVVPEGFDIIVLGTPQTEQSIYNTMRGRGYACRIWPARYPTLEEREVYGTALAEDVKEDLIEDPALVGKSTEPGRFSDSDLAERELSYGRSGFRLQFMLDTSLSDAERYPLKLSDLIVLSVESWRDKTQDRVGPVSLQWTRDPRNAISELANPGFAGDRFHRPLFISEEQAKWQGTVMVIDPSGRGGDETAYAIVRALNGTLYLVGSGGFRDGFSPETLSALVLAAKEKGVNHVLVESNFGDGMYTKLLEPVFAKDYPCTIEEYRVTGQKERRIIDDLEPVMNQHRLVVDEAVITDDLRLASDDPQYSLFYQLTHMTKERGALRHEDRLEVLARACRYFRDQLAVDATKAEAQHRAKLQQVEYEDFMRRCRREVRSSTYHGLHSGVTTSVRQGVLRRQS